jgi:cysteinyl-tRNA synthetase
VRLGLLTAHNRQPLDWTDRLLQESRRRLDRMYAALRDGGIAGPGVPPGDADLPVGVLAALEDDINTPEALAQLAEFVRGVNRSTDADERRRHAAQLRAGGWLLGLLQRDPEQWFAGAVSAGGLADADIEGRLREREQFRAERRFADADRIRDELADHGIVIEDGAGGTRWRRS